MDQILRQQLEVPLTAACPDGTVAFAVNWTGDVVGDGPGSAGLLWSPGRALMPLAMPAGHQPSLVTVINDHEIGGHSFPENEIGSRPDPLAVPLSTPHYRS